MLEGDLYNEVDCLLQLRLVTPDNKIHWANVGPTWGRQDPSRPHVGHTKLAILEQLTNIANPSSPLFVFRHANISFGMAHMSLYKDEYFVFVL